MTSVAVLQARTNSSRLPGKVLLPVGGMPIAVLAAKRAANTGRHVIVATSEENSDNALAHILDEHGLAYSRGSLHNTLKRMVDALADYSDDALVFRLTADNVFPDGALLDEVEADFIARGLDYLCCNGEASGLPYGVSVELTRLKHLRNAASNSKSQHDREHVTPYIRREFGEVYFEKYRHLEMGHFRCTVDCLDDYFSVSDMFTGVADPVSLPLSDLIQRLGSAPFQPKTAHPASRLVLGTAQLGVEYGIANTSGQPERDIARSMVKAAIANGISYIDTARSYGDSETIIGEVIKQGWEGRCKIITKLPTLSGCPSDASTDVVNAFVDASVYQSCSALNMKRLDVLMLHRASHLLDWNGAAWKRLCELKEQDVISELGVSVQTPDELESALASPHVTHIQMPYSVLDWRWDSVIPLLREIKKSRKLVVHVRSALLQGLLCSEEHGLWRRAHVENPDNIIHWLKQKSQQALAENVMEFCLQYVNAMDWVDGVVVGMETPAQLAENLALFGETLSSKRKIDRELVLADRPTLQDKTLNPAWWESGRP